MTNRGLTWDHNPIGLPVTIHPTFVKPLTVLLKEQTLGVGCRYLSSANREHGMFNATVGVDKNGEGLIVSIDKFNEATDGNLENLLLPGDIAVPCVFHQRAACLQDRTLNDLACSLKSLHRSVSSVQTVSLSRCTALDLHLHLVGPNCKVYVEGLFPGVTFRAVPVPPLPLLPTALSQTMAAASVSNRKNCNPKTGFLSMDHNKKILLLLENDPRVNGCPLIGIWVSDVETAAHPFVWASCLRFISCPNYIQRAVRPEQPFLLLVYSTLHSGPEFYDCLISGASSKVTYTLLEGKAQLVVTKVPSFSSRVCCMDLVPVENSKKLKVFQEAWSIFQRDIPPVPYCETHKITFPLNNCDYPRSTPTPPQKAFILKPSVPDLSLLSECSRIIGSAQRPILPQQASPLIPQQHLTQPTCIPNQINKGRVERQILPLFQNSSPSDNKIGPVNCSQISLEPMPRQELPNYKRKPAYDGLQIEVVKLGESRKPKSVDESKSENSNKMNLTGQRNSNTEETAICNVISTGGANLVSSNSSKRISDQKINYVTSIDAVSNNFSPPTVQQQQHDFQLFQNFQKFLIEKELQEQVKMLLESQQGLLKNCHLQPQHPSLTEDKENLSNKIDKQSEQLEELKTQFGLLVKNSNQPLDSISKCSVGVMTSFYENRLPNSQLLNACDNRVSPILQPVTQRYEERLAPTAHLFPRDSRSRDPSQVEYPGHWDRHRNLPGNINLSSEQDILRDDGNQVESFEKCNTSARNMRYREYHHPLSSNTENRLPNSNINNNEKCQNTSSGNRVTSNGTSKQAYTCNGSNCSCLSMERIRASSLPKQDTQLEDLSLPEMNRNSALSHLTHSVDASLPLGASVSMMETQMRKHDEGSLEESSFEVPTTTFYRDLQLRVDQLIQNQPRRAKGASRRSLPGNKAKEQTCDQRRRSMDNHHNIHAWSNNQSPQKWDGSILLPSLNYQTLCLSDDGDSDSGEDALNLTKKYLGIVPQGQRSNFHLQGQRSQPAKDRTKKSNFSIDASKNMSFATKAYLERHGLVTNS